LGLEWLVKSYFPCFYGYFPLIAACFLWSGSRVNNLSPRITFLTLGTHIVNLSPPNLANFSPLNQISLFNYLSFCIVGSYWGGCSETMAKTQPISKEHLHHPICGHPPEAICPRLRYPHPRLRKMGIKICKSRELNIAINGSAFFFLLLLLTEQYNKLQQWIKTNIFQEFLIVS